MSRIRRCLMGLAACVLVAVAPAGAQEFAFAAEPRTGDAAMDARLADIDQYGTRYREAFVDELVRYRAAPRTLVGALLADEHWAPGDVYYACALAQVAGRPCSHVLERWREAHATGWGPVAEALGVTAGSDEQARLAEGMTASYRRWGRPLSAAAAAAPPTDD